MKSYKKWFTTVLMVFAATSSKANEQSYADEYSYMMEGKPYAEAIVRDVSRDWNADKLITQADPRMLKVFPEREIRKLIADCAKALGSVKSQVALAGNVGRETAIPGKTASYDIQLNAEKSNARIRVKLQKIGEQWKVLGFWVQLPPQTPSSLLGNKQ